VTDQCRCGDLTDQFGGGRLAPAQQAMEEQLDALLAGPNEAPFDVGELVLPSDRRTRAVTSAAAASNVPRLSSAVSNPSRS
jgi:hypothetical protein